MSNTKHIPFEAPNLDCSWPDDLRATAEVFILLASYAKTKARAMEFRSRGDITRATELEAHCDKVYSQLPYDVRW